MIALLIKASFVLTVMVLFYKTFLERESFFSINRIYLIGCVVLTFSLPFVSLPQLIDDQGMISSMIEIADEPESALRQQHDVEQQQPDAQLQKNEFASAKTTLVDWVLRLYFFGVVVFALNLISQIISIFLKVVKSSHRVRYTDGVIVNTNSVKEPCSFFYYIFINPEDYDYDTYEEILTHEKIHVRKLHAIDLLLSELAVVVLWFNPLIWLFRKQVEKNIEYQTDDLMLREGTVEKERYQMRLLQIATHNKPLTITTNYNQSLLKQRILKMSAKKSNPSSYWKYAFMIPVLFFILLMMNKPFAALAQTARTEEVVTNEHENESSDECASLLRAVRSKNIAKVKELLKTIDPDCAYMGDGEPRSPLVAAAREGNVIIGQLLIDAGADVEYHASGDESPLMAAAWNGRLDFVKYLVTHGAKVNKKLSGDGTALLVASREGHIETVKYLISQGADVDGQVDHDGTPLICAVRNGHYEIAKVLLENGADPYLTSPGDEYAMYHAVMSKDKSMIGLLKKYEKDK